MSGALISLDFGQLWIGAQTMVNALGSPYLLIIGFSFGMGILGAIAAAILKFKF